MSSNKNSMVFIIILLIGIAVAYPFLKEEAGLETQSEVGAGASALLAEVQSIKLDAAALSNKYFSALLDRTLPPLNLPKGKKNPFAN